MGYYIHQHETSFTIKAANIPAALEAVNKAIAEWGGLPQTSLIAVLEEDRWAVTVDSQTGDITHIQFTGEKGYQELDESDILSQIAGQVEAGSFIKMSGEDGAVWRWEFDGTSAKTATLA